MRNFLIGALLLSFLSACGKSDEEIAQEAADNGQRKIAQLQSIADDLNTKGIYLLTTHSRESIHPAFDVQELKQIKSQLKSYIQLGQEIRDIGTREDVVLIGEEHIVSSTLRAQNYIELIDEQLEIRSTARSRQQRPPEAPPGQRRVRRGDSAPNRPTDTRRTPLDRQTPHRPTDMERRNRAGDEAPNANTRDTLNTTISTAQQAQLRQLANEMEEIKSRLAQQAITVMDEIPDSERAVSEQLLSIARGEERVRLIDELESFMEKASQWSETLGPLSDQSPGLAKKAREVDAETQLAQEYLDILKRS